MKIGLAPLATLCLFLLLVALSRALRPATGGSLPDTVGGAIKAGDRSLEAASEDRSGGGGGGVTGETYATGSRLPDCSHACGPCFPCKRVMVSFVCSSVSESCPIVYRCMCRGRYYHVPSK